LESEAFYKLIDEVVQRLNTPISSAPSPDEWIELEEVMSLLKIRSKTTIQKLRDTGKIRFSKLGPKQILYHRPSILAYIENNVKEMF